MSSIRGTIRHDRKGHQSGAHTPVQPASPEPSVPPPEEERAFASDFETRYNANAQSQIKSEAVRQFLTVPSGDVIIERTPRKYRTVGPPVPEEVKNVELPSHVADCVATFTQPYTTVRYLAGGLGGRESTPVPEEIELPPQFTVDAHQTSMAVDESLLQPYSVDILKQDAVQRTENRLPFFALMSIKKVPESTDQRGAGARTLYNWDDYRLNVSLTRLNFEGLESIEPLFVSLTLYDIQARAPLSETFSVSVSDPALIRKLKGRPSPAGNSTQGISASFRVSKPSKDIYLLVRLEKILVGDVDTCTSIYSKTPVKPKESAKFAALVNASAQRIGAFTQCFGLGLMALFKEDGAPMYGSVKRSFMLDRITRLNGDLSEESLLKNLKPLLSEKSSKLKYYPGCIQFELQAEPPHEPAPGKVTPALLPIEPQGGPIMREIQEFYTEETGLVPPSEWVNHLYVYPLSLNMSNWSGKGNARNLSMEISVRELDSDPIKGRNLPIIYGAAHEPDFVGSRVTAVSYHSPKPVFHEEVKIRLPPRVTRKHHLLIKIIHVNVRPKSKEKPGEETNVVAYAVLPLINGDGKFLADEEHYLSTVYALTPDYLSPEAEDNFKFVEKNRKPNLVMRTRVVSTIHSQDATLNQFFSAYDLNVDDNNLRQAVNGMRVISSALALKWFPVLIRNLTLIMCRLPTAATQDAAFQAMMFIVDSVSRRSGNRLSERDPSLVAFLHQYFELPQYNEKLYVALICAYVRTLQQKNAEVSEIVCRQGWFVFDMIIKCMQLALHDHNLLDESVHRDTRFTAEVGTELAKMAALTLDEVHSKGSMARFINENLAFFLKDLLSMFDRGLVMDLIYLYQSKLPLSAVSLRFEFLRIICDYEHYVQLNLPLPDRIADIPTLEMTLWTNHFLSTLLVREITKQLRTQEWVNILAAVDVLYFLLIKHSVDPRYQNMLAYRCIPGIYFAYVIQLADVNNDNYRCLADAPLALRRKILAIFLWIVKNMQRKVLQQWWNLDTPKRVTSFFVILANCVDTFEYLREDTSASEGQDLLQSTKLRSTMKYDENSMAARPTYTPDRERKENTRATAGGSQEDLQEQNASREATLIVIDLLMDFMNDQAKELRRPDSPYMDRVVINLLVLMLCRHQCMSVLCSLFSAVRHTVVMFPGAFFNEQTPYCGEIAYAVLRHLDSKHTLVRAKAGAIFYLLLRNNFLAVQNISRMKLQATIAVSRLVGEGSQMDPDQFKATLMSVSNHAQQDAKVPARFKEEVVSLTERLFTVLLNSIRIQEFSYDPEMTEDLYWEISRGYVASPDLRAAWLQNLASFHETHENHEEAAQCQIHLAALISVYINELKPKERVLVNPLQFHRAAPNSDGELHVTKESFEEEGICQSSLFTRQGMFSQLKSSVKHLKQDSLFESCIAVQRLNVEVLRENRNYSDMHAVFEDLHVLARNILTANQSNSRLFSNYYLVALYGQCFGDLHGQQFIYKERQMTRLADLSSRLVEQYQAKFGECKTLAASDMDKAKGLDPAVPHVLALTVKPYFSNEELDTGDRNSPFERQFNIHRFIYESPMTTTGKKYSDEITEQAKKKTILTIDGSFPYVVKRLRVINEVTEILSPIQTSTELIEDRCRTTQQELNAIPPNSKTLQIVLQGSVLLQVNAGPLAIARTFMNNRGAYPPEDVQRLEEALRLFVKLCQQAVKLNKTLIGPDQREFQEHLEKGFISLRDEIAQLVDDQPSPSSTS